MPKCINDPSKTYKGDEPSPKGLGYCAHAEKEDKIMKGKDGNNWIVKKVKNGSKRWIKTNDKIVCENVGHSDILDDTWAELADSIGIKGVKEVSMSDLQTFSDWKFLKTNNKKKLRSAFRTMLCDKVRGFVLNSNSHVFDDIVD